jgi:hypothetical protein
MKLQDNGNLVVLDSNNQTVWSSSVFGDGGYTYLVKFKFRFLTCEKPGERENKTKLLKSNSRSTIENGERIVCANDISSVEIKLNELYLNNKKVTVNQKAVNVSKIFLDDNGELILFDTQNKSFWKSNTRGSPGVYNVTLHNSGNITIYDTKTNNVIYNSLWNNLTFIREIDDPKNLKLIVPLDFYPLFEDFRWNKVASAAQKIKTIAIIGGKYQRPTEKPNVNYERAIRKLKNAGVEIIGHVNTQGRSKNEIKKDIKSYFAWDIQIRPNGIFLKGQIENLKELKELQEYVANNFGKDAKVISADPKVINGKAKLNYTSENLTMSIQSKSDAKISLIRNFEKAAFEKDIEKFIINFQASNISYIYFTDGSDFESLSSYFDKEIEILASKQKKIPKF